MHYDRERGVYAWYIGNDRYMPTVYQEIADNLLGILKIWYTSGIHLFIPYVCQLDQFFLKS